jgi:hypothetical protein
MFPSLHERHPLGLLVLAGVPGSLAVALAGDPPSVLPGVTLGSIALLYVEKAIVCFSAYLLVLVVVVRAFAGDLPSELRGLKYADRGSKHLDDDLRRLARTEAELRERMNHIERVVARDDCG